MPLEYCVYVLISLKDQNLYVGYTTDLQERLTAHLQIGLAVQGGGRGAVHFQRVEVFQEQQPGGLLGVIEFAGASGILPEHIVNVFECLLKHGHPYSYRHCRHAHRIFSGITSSAYPARSGAYGSGRGSLAHS